MKVKINVKEREILKKIKNDISESESHNHVNVPQLNNFLLYFSLI